MLRQQMRSCDSPKIETVVVQSSTDQLRDEFCQLNHCAPTRREVSLNCHNTSSTDTSSIAITNNNHSNNPTGTVSTLEPRPWFVDSVTNFIQRSAVEPLLPNAFGRIGTQRSSVEPLLPNAFGRIDTQLSSMNILQYYSHVFSRSTACIATRFRECSSTLLDMLWYLYSYIYRRVSSNTTIIIVPLFLLFFVAVILMQTTDRPTLSSSIISPSPHLSTTAPDIRYEFESLHASPFRLLAFLEPTTPIISIPLCTTGSTSHLLAFLESTVPSLPPPSWPLFVIFFLSPVGTVDRDTGINNNNNLLSCSTATSTVYTIQYDKDDNNITISDVATMTTTFYESNADTIADNDSSATIAMITQLYSSPSEHVSSLLSSTLWLHLRCDNYTAFFVILFLSPVGTVTLLQFRSNLFLSPAVDSTTTFHLIDQGKVGYLYHLQILLFNPQDESPSDNVSSALSKLLLILRHDNNNNECTGDDNGLFGRNQRDTLLSLENDKDDCDILAIAIIVAVMMKAYQSPAVKHATSSVVVTPKPYDTVYDFCFDTSLNYTVYILYFDTVFTSASHASPSYDTDSSRSSSSSSSYDNNYTDGTNDNIMSSSIVDTATTVSVSAADELMSAVMQTIISYGTCTTNDGRTVYSSPSSSSFESSNDDVTFSAVADAVTRITLPYMSPSSYDSSNNNPSHLNYNNDLNFDTVIALIVAVAPAIAVGAPSVVKTKTYATIFITLLCSHIIDQGSVLYLILQILLYNQQYVFSCAAVTNDMTYNAAVLVITNISSAFTIVTTAVTMMFHESPSAIHDEMPFAVKNGMISFKSDTDNDDDSANDEATFAIAVIYKYISTSYESPTAVMVEPYDMSYESPSAAIMKTTAPNTSHSIQRDTSVLYDRNLTAITIMNTAVKMMTNSMNTAVYLAVIDAESSADITNAITSYALPFMME